MNVMSERLLQFIWQFQYFNTRSLLTSAGETVNVQFQGHYNTNQGPDFTDARIRIGNTTWVGNVELHISSSDWKKHGHQHDPNYSNVVLHVVWEDDLPEQGMPVLELSSRVPKILLGQYNDWMESTSFIPCDKSVTTLPDAPWQAWKEQLLNERLLLKTDNITTMLAQNNHHWEETCWWLLARYFGGPVNAESFEEIARSIPLSLLHRHTSHLRHLEALLIGQAGLLEDIGPDEEYPLLLQEEYRFLKHKYGLRPSSIRPAFLRMRPSGFPGLRLAQLAMLVHTTTHLLSRILEAESEVELRKWLDVSASEYWHFHYRFGDHSSYRIKRIGRSTIDRLIINAAVPILFAYGNYFGISSCNQKALHWLEQIDAEQNPVIRGFAELGLKTRHAWDTQALMGLKINYCEKRQCLDCAVGNHILQKAKSQA